MISDDPSPAPPPRSFSILVRSTIGLLIVAIIVIATIEAFRNPAVRSFIRHPQRHSESVRDWSSRHPLLAPVSFFGAFLALGSFALPVWWLQVVAGIAFGLGRGLLFGLLAGAVTSAIAAALSRFVFGELLRSRLKTHAERLSRLDQSLNHNGLLVVCGVRLLHFIPAGLSNYAFGLTRIAIRDVAIGSIIGGLPSTLSLVAIGARPGWLQDWRFISVLVLLNLTTIALLVTRFFKPSWFKRFGLEEASTIAGE